MTKEEFKVMRQTAGLRGVEVARAFGIRSETISRWETGVVAVPSGAGLALAALVGDEGKVAAILEGRKGRRREVRKGRYLAAVQAGAPAIEVAVEAETVSSTGETIEPETDSSGLERENEEQPSNGLDPEELI